MRRKITVYGLRFSKTTFWNRINTGFLGPAVATVLTACGIETQPYQLRMAKLFSLQQYLPLAVLKLSNFPCLILVKTWLQQYLPLAVLKHYNIGDNAIFSCNVATVLTACGIETFLSSHFYFSFLLSCNSTYRLRY